MLRSSPSSRFELFGLGYVGDKMKANQTSTDRRRSVARQRRLRRWQSGANTVIFVVAYQWSFRAMLLAKRWNY